MTGPRSRPADREKKVDDSHESPNSIRAIAQAEAIESVTWLIDNQAVLDAVDAAIRSATSSIWICQLAIDADCIVNRDAGSQTFLESLIEAASKRQVLVRILVNASLLLDTAKPLRRFLTRTSAPTDGIEIRGISAFPQLLHAKVVIVDGSEAFLVGSPLVNDYWDTPAHLPFDAARPTRELAGRPLHDVSLSIKGPAVEALKETYLNLWDNWTSTPPYLLSRPTIDRKSGRIEIASTLPKKNNSSSETNADTGILDAVLMGIGSAERLVYIEHQYLSSRRVISELEKALVRCPDLEIIMVLNQNPDITAYQKWQNTRLRESGMLNHPRVGLFSIWSAVRSAAGRTLLNQIFVHSKVVAIDDKWAMVGSANLDGVSLHSYGDDFTGRIGRRVFRDVRNFDVAAIVHDSASNRGAGSVFDLRSSLWVEHLGSASDAILSPSSVDRPIDHWRRIAWKNLALLKTHSHSAGAAASVMKGHILPYSTEMMPPDQLHDLGLNIESSQIDLAFKPTWMNARFSPNWIRNMFL